MTLPLVNDDMSIKDKLSANEWTTFRNDNLGKVIAMGYEEYTYTQMPSPHNNSVIKLCGKVIKDNEEDLDSQQCEALLDSFGMKIVYDLIKRSGLYETLNLCDNIAAYFHTYEKCFGIDVAFLDEINISRDRGKLVIKTMPRRSAMEFDLADLLHVYSNRMTLINIIFAYDYIFHKDDRYEGKRIVALFDQYYKPFVKRFKDKVYSTDNALWVINKFPKMLMDVIAWDATDVHDVSGEDVPNVEVRRQILDETVMYIRKYIPKLTNVPDNAYIQHMLLKYDEYKAKKIKDL